jgi:RNA-directed DNA polymerase
MATVKPVGAVSHELNGWHDIDWRAAHENVRRLQARIVKATKEGKHHKVKALQYLLTHSFSGKAIAVKRVTENQGKNTPGVDETTWVTPQSKMMAVRSLEQHGYAPLPLKRVYIPKSNGKKRPLGIPTMKDRAMQALYLLALDPIAECQADSNSYGFRKERSCADAIEQCFKSLAQKGSAQWILEGDISACFDKISHQWLLANVPTDKTVLRKWLKSGYLEKSVFFDTEDGTPQGGIISPVLANFALDGLEQHLRENFPTTGKGTVIGRRAKLNYSRYADDFIITGSSKELLENEIKPLVETFMGERGLQLSKEKTVITHINDGFDFLGQNVRKYNDKLLIKPSKKNVKTFLDNIRMVVKTNKQATAGELIRKLNLKIRGWANYHRHVVSKRTFSAVDNAIYHCLWRWAKRRHPMKSGNWIMKKYFCTRNGDNWTFFGSVPGTDGKTTTYHLVAAAKTPIVRHTKIKGEANPYDPADEIYFEQRLGVKMEANLRGRRQLSRLWREQKGICPVCNRPITELTGWHSHHMKQRVMGGSDTSENRVLLHPNCHSQVHVQGLSVSKPRPPPDVTRA